LNQNSQGNPPLRGIDIRRYRKTKWGWVPYSDVPKTYLSRVYSCPFKSTRCNQAQGWGAWLCWIYWTIVWQKQLERWTVNPLFL